MFSSVFAVTATNTTVSPLVLVVVLRVVGVVGVEVIVGVVVVAVAVAVAVVLAVVVAAAVVVAVVVVVVVRALYVFDDLLFWLSRNWRSKKTLQNAVLRKGATLKRGQSSESGFSASFRIIMMARHKITVPRSVSGSVCVFQYMHF